jgi:catechol 2,3-dioxygenase-like lactoylglutathione lyase family enzyme
MISQAINHVSFSVPDLEKAMHFYQDVLGCEPIERPDFGFPGAWLQAGNVQIHLIVAPEGMTGLGSNPDRTIPLANHTAFAVDDYQKTRDHLTEHGLEVVETSPEQGQMWVSDPAGNIIEFISVAR